MTEKSIGQYTVFERLGEGGVGEVCEAEDQKLRQVVALRFLPQGASASEQDKPRFLREAQALGSLSIPASAP